MVVDTSIILSIFFNEAQGVWAADQLERYKNEIKMSSVNLSECLILLQDRQPKIYGELKERLMGGAIEFVSVSPEHGAIAAQARMKFQNLNLGDCFAYALANETKDAILTLDTAFLKTDVKTILPPKSNR